MAVKIVVDQYDGFYQIVGLDGEHQVGLLTLNTSSSATDPANPSCRLATVKWIGVTPKHRGFGIATRMYERAARLAASLGRTLASDQVFLKAGRGFWQKQEARGRARKIGKRWILTCTPRTRLKNPGSGPIQPCSRCGQLVRAKSGNRGAVVCAACGGARRNPQVKKLSSGVVVVNAAPSVRDSVIAALVRAGFTLTNYSSGTLAVGGATSVAEVQAALGYLANPPDDVIVIEHGAAQNARGKAYGWVPQVSVNGRRIASSYGGPWHHRGYELEEAEALAAQEAQREAGRYVGDWKVTVRKRNPGMG